MESFHIINYPSAAGFVSGVPNVKGAKEVKLVKPDQYFSLIQKD